MFEPSLDFVEPAEGQRHSTWSSTPNSSRGPKPHPDWLVTSGQAVDTELGILKTGKEADVHLLERADPVTGKSCVLAAKRYRPPETTSFHRSAAYTEGRRVRDSREMRAMASKTAFGRSIAADQWAAAEFGHLCRLHEAGVAVPYPVSIDAGEILMQFLGDGTTGAPRLAATTVGRDELRDLFDQVVVILRGIAELGWAHGDLSAYNMLVHEGVVVVIDVPQVVDIAINPNGMTMLERDVRNVCDWFERKGVGCDRDELLGDLASRVFG